MLGKTAIREGDSLKVGLSALASSWTIYRALPSRVWPGTDSVRVCQVWMSKRSWNGRFYIDNALVAGIGTDLTAREIGLAGAQAKESPFALAAGVQAFQGSHNGQGAALVLSDGDPALDTLARRKNPFLRRYVTGDDITTHGLRELSRWVIDCEDLPLREVERVSPETYAFLLDRVKPSRTAEILAPYPGLADRWWQLWNHRAGLYRRLRQLPLCLCVPFVAKYVIAVEAPTDYVFTNKICVIEDSGDLLRLALSSTVFDLWAWEHSGSTPARSISLHLAHAVHGFPLPAIASPSTGVLSADWFALVGDFVGRGGGLTDFFNLFHDRDTSSPVAEKARKLRTKMDEQLVASYGWPTADLSHDFHETEQGVRFTLQPAARVRLLNCLLELNHQRYIAEEAQGLHKKRTSKGKAGASGKRGKKDAKGSPLLEGV
jgi:hypothetical protein